MPEVKYLVMVTSANNNKFYKMIPNGNEFKVEYGRLGMSSFQTATYPISQFDKKYNEKIKKGYVDKTELIEELVSKEEPTKENSSSEYKPISDAVVAKIVERLQDMARKTIEANYKVSSNMVTQKMVDESQECLNQLIHTKDVLLFNDILLQNFSIISRRMGRVSDWLAKSCDDFESIITREQGLLDVMAGQVKQNLIDKKNKEAEQKASEKGKASGKTILSAMGISIKKVTKKEEEAIKKLLGENASRYVNAWKVTNKKTQKEFDDYLKELGEETEVRQLWHGSRNENWWSIITTGLVLRPTNAIISGKMFGYGIYFAPDSSKSMGYTSQMNSYWARGNSSTGFLSLYDVIYGEPYIIDKNYYSYSGLGQLTYENLQKVKPGANSVHALKEVTGLRRDEIIVYKEAQATIKYLVEVRA